MKDLRRLSTQTLNANQFTHGMSLEKCIKCGKPTLGRAKVGNNTAICAACYTKEQNLLGQYGQQTGSADAGRMNLPY